MNTDFLKHELRQLDTETFEVEDIPELGIDLGAEGIMLEAELGASSSSSCSTSSCCSCSTSSCCSCSTSCTASTSSCG